MFGYAIFVVAMLVMKLAPHSPPGRWLNLALVERPLQRLAAMDRRQVIFTLLMIGFVLFASEAIMAMGSFDLFTAFTWDLAAYLDVMAVAYALAAVSRARAGLKWLAARVSLRFRRNPRARRTWAARRPDRSANNNDDEPGPAWRLAA